MALEWSVTCVFSVMAGKFIRSCKLPSASLPVAMVRFLSSVRSQMSFEMRTLGVGLPASRMRTGVCGGALPPPGATTFPSDHGWSWGGWDLDIHGISWGVTEQFKKG